MPKKLDGFSGDKNLMNSAYLKDFFFRGTIRAAKDRQLRDREAEAFSTMNRLKACLDYLKKMHFREKFSEFTAFKEPFYDRVFTWIRGIDHTLDLEHKEYIARALEDDARHWSVQLEILNKSLEAYKKAAKDMHEAATDAINYDRATMRGWTWWR